MSSLLSRFDVKRAVTIVALANRVIANLAFVGMGLWIAWTGTFSNEIIFFWVLILYVVVQMNQDGVLKYD